jgi:hypothetical protein
MNHKAEILETIDLIPDRDLALRLIVSELNVLGQHSMYHRNCGDYFSAESKMRDAANIARRLGLAEPIKGGK